MARNGLYGAIWLSRDRSLLSGSHAYWDSFSIEKLYGILRDAQNGRRDRFHLIPAVPSVSRLGRPAGGEAVTISTM